MVKHIIAIAVMIAASGHSGTACAQANSLELFTGGQYTRPAKGFFPAKGVRIIQGMPATGPSRGAEYCHDVRTDIACLTYFRTPTVSQLLTPTDTGQWPVTDTDFELKLKFPLRKIAAKLPLSPYLTVGGGAIMLNGGTTAKQKPGYTGSGWNGQGDGLVGAGFDRKLSSFLAIRADLAVVILKQTGFGDVSYRSSYTDKTQLSLGFVHYLRMPGRLSKNKNAGR